MSVIATAQSNDKSLQFYAPDMTRVVLQENWLFCGKLNLIGFSNLAIKRALGISLNSNSETYIHFVSTLVHFFPPAAHESAEPGQGQ